MCMWCVCVCVCVCVFWSYLRSNYLLYGLLAPCHVSLSGSKDSYTVFGIKGLSPYFTLEDVCRAARDTLTVTRGWVPRTQKRRKRNYVPIGQANASPKVLLYDLETPPPKKKTVVDCVI